VADPTSWIVAGSSALVALSTLTGRRKMSDIHRDVQTGNELRMGQLAAAQESRRIEAKDPSARTFQEAQHLHQLPTPSAD